ncbi:S-ribosylhomocysteine lyase [Treponema sp.]|uniref:S-ribosylhomocysteine lyase n=1 Tax=Treponema sp. TaxID=166 RepID=UPI00388F119B
MDKIASFTIDHIKLEPGLYVSRIDKFGESFITTFDIRITSPNDEPVLNTAELHTIEHLCATFARNDKEWAEKIVYFGPMGCRTGCYLLVEGKVTSKEMVPFMTKMFEFVRDFEGEIPGAKPEECGNYLDQNLPMAKYVAKRYLENTLYNIDDAHLNYPA